MLSPFPSDCCWFSIYAGKTRLDSDCIESLMAVREIPPPIEKSPPAVPSVHVDGCLGQHDADQCGTVSSVLCAVEWSLELNQFSLGQSCSARARVGFVTVWPRLLWHVTWIPISLDYHNIEVSIWRFKIRLQNFMKVEYGSLKFKEHRIVDFFLYKLY